MDGQRHFRGLKHVQKLMQQQGGVDANGNPQAAITQNPLIFSCQICNRPVKIPGGVPQSGDALYCDEHKQMVETARKERIAKEQAKVNEIINAEATVSQQQVSMEGFFDQPTAVSQDPPEPQPVVTQARPGEFDQTGPQEIIHSCGCDMFKLVEEAGMVAIVCAQCNETLMVVGIFF